MSFRMFVSIKYVVFFTNSDFVVPWLHYSALTRPPIKPSFLNPEAEKWYSQGSPLSSTLLMAIDRRTNSNQFWRTTWAYTSPAVTPQNITFEIHNFLSFHGSQIFPSETNLLIFQKSIPKSQFQPLFFNNTIPLITRLKSTVSSSVRVIPDSPPPH